MAEELELDLPAGRVHAERRGAATAPLVLCGHGLSANLRAFDPIAEALAARGRQVVAVDFRGRGGSEVTPPGTYGLAAHADDLVATAGALGADRFSYAGWSMGALIGLHLAARAGDRLERLVLVDHAGAADERAGAAVLAGLARLDAVVDEPAQYVEKIRAAGAVAPWGPLWEAVYRYELERTDGGWTPRTSRAAATEDLEAIVGEDPRELWPVLTMPVLLARARAPLGGGWVVPEADRDALRAAVPAVEIVESERNHFGVMTDPVVVDAVARFLGQ